MSKKLISFSLWGDNPKYTIGAVRNAELALQIYPGWICRFYVGRSVPLDITHKLKSFSNTEVVEMDEKGDWTSMFWRFFPASETDVEIMISRDADSRLSLREKAAVDEWLASDKGFHIMRDHPWHGVEILGGMWGAKRGVIIDIKPRIEKFLKNDAWGVDQSFLKTEIYPLIKGCAMVHDEFFNDPNRRPFPTERKNYEFVGDVFDFEDKRDDQFWRVLESFISFKK
jgi:hypothetical protein